MSDQDAKPDVPSPPTSPAPAPSLHPPVKPPSPSPSPSPASPPSPSPPAPRPDDRITLRVRDENENEFSFMMKRCTPFRKIFDAFAHKVNERVRSFRFHFEGLRLAEDDSPERVGLVDDDCIDAFVLAEGG